MKKIIFISAVCGVGKSTTCEYIKKYKLLENYDIFDVDDLVNVHEYNQPGLLYEDAIKKAAIKSGDKNIVLASCVNPVEIKQINIPSDIDSKKMILLYCIKEELERRLKARDKSRECSSDEFINGQIEYQKYMLDHIDLFQLSIDNTKLDIKDVATKIVNYIKENENEIKTDSTLDDRIR